MKELLDELIKRQHVIEGINIECADAAHDINLAIETMKKELVTMEKVRDYTEKPYNDKVKLLEYGQYETKERILKTWDKAKKTLKFDSGTIKFRTTTSLNIKKPDVVLGDLVERLATMEEVMEYVSGFSKTKLKGYIGVHKMDADVIELVAKTGVSFVENNDL